MEVGNPMGTRGTKLNEAPNEALIKKLEQQQPCIKGILSKKELKYGKIMYMETKDAINTMDEKTLETEENNWYLLRVEQPKKQWNGKKLEEATEQM